MGIDALKSALGVRSPEELVASIKNAMLEYMPSLPSGRLFGFQADGTPAPATASQPAFTGDDLRDYGLYTAGVSTSVSLIMTYLGWVNFPLIINALQGATLSIVQAPTQAAAFAKIVSPWTWIGPVIQVATSILYRATQTGPEPIRKEFTLDEFASILEVLGGSLSNSQRNSRQVQRSI